MQGHSPRATSEPVVIERPALLVGGASFDARLAEKLVGRGFALIAADGAADELALVGLTPEFIIGDMDSIADAGAFAGRSRVIRLEEQETTDLEKCLYATQAPLYVGLGLTGQRFDHTLAALHAATKYVRDKKLILVDTHDIAVALSGRFAFEAAAGERVSIYPLAPIRFAASKGLAYPLDGLELAPGVRIGTSNMAIGEGPVEIEPVPGADAPWLLIVANSNLDQMIERLAPSG
jgi:thiamine pyrophosphokinase